MDTTAPSARHSGFVARLRELRRREPFRFPATSIPERFGRAAVLLPFWADPTGEIRVLLTRRSEDVTTHKGQVSFPGGRLLDGEDFLQAALRETEEEVGIERHQLEVLGRLDDAWSGAGHFIVPYVAWLETPPRLRPCAREVAELLTPDLTTLLDPACQARHTVEHGGVQYTNSELHFEGGEVIGLSADLLLEVLEWGDGATTRRGEQRLRDLYSFEWNGEPPG